MSTNQPNSITSPINPTLSTAAQDAVMTAIATIRQNLPFLTDLTTTGRKSLSKLGDKTHAFVKKAVDIAAQHPQILPASHSVDDIRNSAQLFQSISTIRLALEQLNNQVNDTTIKVGNEAYTLARAVYAATKSPLAGPNLATAADNLGKRYGRKTRPAKSETPAPANGAPQPSSASSTAPPATHSTPPASTPPQPHA